MKSQRAFWMQVQGASQTWTFQSPLTLELDITRAMFQSLAEGTFVLFNLSPTTRRDIYQDWSEQGTFRQVTVRAGYRSWSSVPGAPAAQGPGLGLGPQTGQQNLQALPLIFSGNITKAQSQRQGPNWLTTIHAWDGGFAVTHGDVNTPLAAGIKTTQQFQTLIAAMGSTVSVGYIDPSLDADNITGVSFAGSPWDKITQMANALYATAFIDLGKVYVVGKGNTIPGLTGGLTEITPETGLLDTPEKQNTKICFPMMFEPRLKVGQQIILRSLETVNNGSYPVVGLDHVGTFSDAVGHDLRTRVTCYYSQAYVGAGAIQ